VGPGSEAGSSRCCWNCAAQGRCWTAHAADQPVPDRRGRGCLGPDCRSQVRPRQAHSAAPAVGPAVAKAPGTAKAPATAVGRGPAADRSSRCDSAQKGSAVPASAVPAAVAALVDPAAGWVGHPAAAAKGGTGPAPGTAYAARRATRRTGLSWARRTTPRTDSARHTTARRTAGCWPDTHHAQARQEAALAGRVASARTAAAAPARAHRTVVRSAATAMGRGRPAR
jgi:hypothetical protein